MTTRKPSAPSRRSGSTRPGTEYDFTPTSMARRPPAKPKPAPRKR